MLSLLIIIITGIILVTIFVKEPRIFLALFQKLAFPKSKGDTAFVNKMRHFPESVLLEKDWALFRDEFQHVVDGQSLPKFHQVDKLNNKISFDSGPAWRTVILKAYDGWFRDNCNLFPITYNLLRNRENISTVMYSVLEPGTQIPPHTGKLKGVFRYHLALHVPKENDCFIMINDEKYFWREGEGVLFDDTFIHTVSNNTSDYRVVLFLDIKKASNAFINSVNNFLLRLIVKSPLFKKGVRRGTINID